MTGPYSSAMVTGEAGEMKRWIRNPFENQMAKCAQCSHSVRRVADLEQYIQCLLLLGTWPVLTILCQLFNLQSYATGHIPLLLPFPLREIETQATVRPLPQALQWVESDTTGEAGPSWPTVDQREGISLQIRPDSPRHFTATCRKMS